MEKDKGRGSVQVGGCGVLVIHFFSVYAPLVKRFSLPIRRVRGREARFVDSLFFATPKSKRVLMHAWRHMPLTLWLVLGRAQVPYSYCMHFAK